MFKDSRAAVLSSLALAMAFGVVGYHGILYGPFPLGIGCAYIVAGLVFLAVPPAPDGSWTALRSRMAGVAGILWGLYLALFARGFTYWILDIPFFIAALLLWLGRDRAIFLLSSSGILAVIAIRHAPGPAAVALLDLLLLGAFIMGGAGRVEAWLARRAAVRAASVPKPWSPGRIGAALAVFAVLAVQVARPAWLMVNPEKRRLILESLSPAFPIRDPASLSPLAARLRGHVVALSQDIGARSAYEPGAQEKAKDYIVSRLREAGYPPEVFDYVSRRQTDFLRREPYHNVEARLGSRGGGAWIVGAHYDSAPGTNGADDNATGVAVLLEAARLLKDESPARDIRFVAFGTEEPPAFGTRDMGSWRYAHDLRERGVEVHGVLNLEMLGYFNPRPASQLFPPFLDLFYPDRGDFIGLVSNLSSAGLLRPFKDSWKGASRLPLELTVLPSVFSAVALSDQLNFWSEGYRAVMLSDTSFFRYPHYHQSTDTAEKLDYEKMAEAARGIVAVLRAR